MAYKCLPNVVYHAQNPNFGSATLQVVGGSVKIKGSNVTEYDETTKKLIIPSFSDLVDTGDDELSEGIHPVTGLPEFFGFEGDAEAIWTKMAVDPRIKPNDSEESE